MCVCVHIYRKVLIILCFVLSLLLSNHDPCAVSLTNKQLLIIILLNLFVIQDFIRFQKFLEFRSSRMKYLTQPYYLSLAGNHIGEMILSSTGKSATFLTNLLELPARDKSPSVAGGVEHECV